MFILALARQHGLGNRLQANRAAKPYPLIFQTIKLVGYETICSIARIGPYNAKRTVPTVDQEGRVRALIVKTYSTLNERFVERRRLNGVISQPAVAPRASVSQTERHLLDELFAPANGVRRAAPLRASK